MNSVDDAVMQIRDNQWRDRFQLQGTEGFEHFVSRFFYVCQVPGYQATFWIIKLTMKDGKGNSRTFFAAGRNDQNRHVENVFIEWWNAHQPQMEQQGYTYNEVKGYTNYTPCSECAPTLREWLAARPHIEFSIHYIYMHIDTEEVQMRELTELENVVGVQRIDDASLRQLARDVGFEQQGYGYQIPVCWRQADHGHRPLFDNVRAVEWSQGINMRGKPAKAVAEKRAYKFCNTNDNKIIF